MNSNIEYIEYIKADFIKRAAIELGRDSTQVLPADKQVVTVITKYGEMFRATTVRHLQGVSWMKSAKDWVALEGTRCIA